MRSEVTEDNAFETVNFHISCFFTSMNDAVSLPTASKRDFTQNVMIASWGYQVSKSLESPLLATLFRKAMQPQLARSARLVLPTESSVSAYVTCSPNQQALIILYRGYNSMSEPKTGQMKNASPTIYE